MPSRSAAFAAGPVRLAITHPDYEHVATRSERPCAELLADLQGRWESGGDSTTDLGPLLETTVAHARRYLATIDDRPVGAEAASLAELRRTPRR